MEQIGGIDRHPFDDCLQRGRTILPQQRFHLDERRQRVRIPITANRNRCPRVIQLKGGEQFPLPLTDQPLYILAVRRVDGTGRKLEVGDGV